MLIRKYKKTDREAVEKIHFETGFLGKSLSQFLSNNDIWKGSIAYYLNNEPESTFVLVDGKKVVGYIIGCLDDRKHNGSLNFAWDVFYNTFRSALLPEKDQTFWRSKLMTFFDIMIGWSGEIHFRIPKRAGHLHINLLKKYRGASNGSKLLNKFLDYARDNGVRRIHADSYQTKLNPNQNFWLNNGFRVYSKVKTTLWSKQLPKEDIFLICYVIDL